MSQPTFQPAQQPQPVWGQTPQPPLPQPSRVKRVLLALGIAFGSWLIGFWMGSLGSDTATTAPPLAPAESSETSGNTYGEDTAPPPGEPEDATAPTSYTPKNSDFVLKLKTTDKQCFGSAGCSVTVKVTPQFAGAGGVASLPDQGTIDITYKLTGDESGPITGTATVELADMTVTGEETSLSTRSSSTKVAATVTDVEYSEFG